MRKILRNRGKAPPVLAMVALLLTLGVMATTPFAYARYYANATFRVSSRVARFEPQWFINSSFVTGTFTGAGDQVGAVMNGGGFVMHPGNWYTQVWGGVGLHKFITVAYRNSSEVAAGFRIRLMSTGEKDAAGNALETAAVHGNYPVGDYVHDRQRVELMLDNNSMYFPNFQTTGLPGLGARIGQGGAWISGWMYNDAQGTVLFNDSGTPRWSMQNPNGGLVGAGNWGFNPLTGSPYRPQGSVRADDLNAQHTGSNWTTGISQSDPIRFGVGNHTITDMNEKWWRSYRLNLSFVAEQLD